MENYSIFTSSSSIFDEDTINTIAQFSETFDDPQFKSDITSLINFEDEHLSPEDKQKWSNYEWKRISEIFGSKIKIKIHLMKDATSLDVMQGSLGNCYLLSVCSVIAEFPVRLEKLFHVKEINQAGIYVILLYLDGELKKIIIDDKIPYNPMTNQPPFCKLSKSNNIWPILIEKAWAKTQHNYQNTISGQPHEIFRVLLGAPSFLLNCNDYATDIEKNTLWSMLQNFYFKNYFICAATFSKNESNSEYFKDLKKELTALGLSLSHAYSCLFFCDFNASGKKLRLIKMRNPWGYLEVSKFQGEMIRQNYMSIPEVNRNIGEPQEGMFVITFEEFLKYFPSVYVCQYHDNYSSISQKIIKNNFGERCKHFNVFKVNLSYVTDCKKNIFFSVSKPMKFSFSRSKEIEQIYSSIFIGRIRNNDDIYDIEYIGHKEGYDSSISIELDQYTPGEYLLFAHINSHNGLIVDPTYLGYISIYTSEENIFYEPLSPTQFSSEKAFCNLFYDYYRNFKSFFTDNLRTIDDDQLMLSNSFALQNSNYGFVVLENFNKDASLRYRLKNIQATCNSPDSGMITTLNNNSSIEGNISDGQFAMLAYFSCSIRYSFLTSPVKSRDVLKKEIKQYGKFHQEIRVINYYVHRSPSALCFCFINVSHEILNCYFNVTEKNNLLCYEYIDQSTISFILPPDDEFYLYFEVEEYFTEFGLKWSLSTKVFH